MGVIGTLAALVIGLVLATAKSTYDRQDEAIRHGAARALLLDRLLSSYGPETNEARALLRRSMALTLHAVWPENRSERPRLGAPEVILMGQEMQRRLLQLSPQSEAQRWLKSEALEVGSEIVEARWLALINLDSSIPVPFLVVVVAWLTLLFGSFAILAPRNVTVVVFQFLYALSVAGSIFLILELDQPFEGAIRVSSAPLRHALSRLGQ
jgi:hypothetical protein